MLCNFRSLNNIGVKSTALLLGLFLSLSSVRAAEETPRDLNLVYGTQSSNIAAGASASYDIATKKLSISDIGFKSGAPVINASAKKGPQLNAGITYDAWEPAPVPAVHWSILVDVSGSTKISKKTDAELAFLAEFIKKLPQDDTCSVIFFAADSQLFGSINSQNDKVSLLEEISKLRNSKKFNHSLDFCRSTFIYACLKNVLYDAQTSRPNRILLLSDGMDETDGTSTSSASSTARSLALNEITTRAQERHIPIFTVGYWQDDSQKRQGYPQLNNLSLETGAIHIQTPVQTYSISLSDTATKIFNASIKHRGSLVIDLSSFKSPADAEDVGVILVDENHQTACLHIAKAQVQALLSLQKEQSVSSQDDGSAAVKAEMVQSIKVLPALIKQVRADLVSFKTLEEQEDLSEAVVTKASDIQKKIDQLGKGISILQHCDAATLNELEQSVRKELGNTHQDEVELLVTCAKLAQLNSLPAEKVLEFLGRKSPLPTAADLQAAEKKKQELIIWCAAGGVALILIVLVLVFVLRKKPAPVAEIDLSVAASAEPTILPSDAPAAMAPQGRVYARIQDVNMSSRVWEIRNASVSIGRNSKNDIAIPNNSVSSSHCVIKLDRDQQWSITDLNSANGVYVNGKRTPKASLKTGDMIELGDVKLHFYI